MKRGWLIVSVTCLSAAVVALLLRHIDSAFVLAAVGAVCWFLDLRSSIRAEMPPEEPEDFDLENEPDDRD